MSPITLRFRLLASWMAALEARMKGDIQDLLLILVGRSKDQESLSAVGCCDLQVIMSFEEKTCK
jgi:hypothetical protein